MHFISLVSLVLVIRSVGLASAMSYSCQETFDTTEGSYLLTWTRGENCLLEWTDPTPMLFYFDDIRMPNGSSITFGLLSGAYVAHMNGGPGATAVGPFGSWGAYHNGRVAITVFSGGYSWVPSNLATDGNFTLRWEPAGTTPCVNSMVPIGYSSTFTAYRSGYAGTCTATLYPFYDPDRLPSGIFYSYYNMSVGEGFEGSDEDGVLFSYAGEGGQPVFPPGSEGKVPLEVEFTLEGGRSAQVAFYISGQRNQINCLYTETISPSDFCGDLMDEVCYGENVTALQEDYTAALGDCVDECCANALKLYFCSLVNPAVQRTSEAFGLNVKACPGFAGLVENCWDTCSTYSGDASSPQDACYSPGPIAGCQPFSSPSSSSSSSSSASSSSSTSASSSTSESEVTSSSLALNISTEEETTSSGTTVTVSPQVIVAVLFAAAAIHL